MTVVRRGCVSREIEKAIERITWSGSDLAKEHVMLTATLVTVILAGEREMRAEN